MFTKMMKMFRTLSAGLAQKQIQRKLNYYVVLKRHEKKGNGDPKSIGNTLQNVTSCLLPLIINQTIDNQRKKKFCMKQTTRKSTNNVVPAWYYQAFSLRAMGFSYEQISERMGYKVDTVKHLFCVNGALHDLWIEWIDTSRKMALDESLMIMYAHLPDIIRARAVQAKQNNMIGYLSSQMIMQYTLGKPDKKTTEGDQAIITFSEWVKEMTIKRQQANAQYERGESLPTLQESTD